MHESLNLISSDFVLRFVVNSLCLILLLRGIYYRNDAQSESSAGFFVFGQGVFFVTALLHNIDMSMGFAFGLFAVFSMLRYRTETLSVRDMTYLFVLIVISLLSSVSSLNTIELIGVNVALCILVALSETSLFSQKIENKIVVYERIELITPDKYSELVDDLRMRLGVEVTNVEIGDVDFLKDTATLKVFYNRIDKSA